MIEELKPSEVEITYLGTVADSLGNAEAEMMAAILVRYLYLHGDTWRSVTIREVADWMVGDAMVKRWTNQPVMGPLPPYEFARRGYITGWEDPDDPGEVTPRFLSLISERGSWR